MILTIDKNLPGNYIHQSNNEYIPGKCNLGSKEIESRNQKAVIGLIISILVIIGLQVFHFSPIVRFILFFPLFYAIICYYQAQQKFCVVFGIKGIFNFGEIGKSTIVSGVENKKSDREKAWLIIFKSIIVALLIVVIYFFLPI